MVETQMNHKIMIPLLLVAWVLFIISTSVVFADRERTYVYNTYVTEENVSQAVSDTDKSEARSIASGQHHFKATTRLQWSVGAGFAGDESALSFGLGLQTGKIFWSGNITGNLFSGDSDPAIGIGGSGTF